MNKLIHPSDIARETLKQLAARRIPPTPDRYEEIYQEIAGTQAKRGANAMHPLATELVSVLRGLPKQTSDLSRQIAQIEKAALSREWHSIPSLVVVAIEAQAGQADLTRSWAELIRELITQWDMRSAHFSPARKSESLGKVLGNFGNHPALLNQKLDALVKSWAEGRGEKAESIPLVDDDLPQVAETRTGSVKVSELDGPSMDWRRWRDITVKTLRLGVAERLGDYPELAEDATSLAQAAEAVSSEQGLDFLNQRLRRFWLQLELKIDKDQRISSGLLNLLMLMSENLSVLAGNDDNIQGQVTIIRDILSQPLNVRSLYDAEAKFKELIYKQGAMRTSLGEAQATLKSMISIFIDRLSVMADNTVGYHDKVATYASRINGTHEIGDLSNLLNDLMQDTRHMQLDIVRSKEEMIDARDKAGAAEQRIAQLEQELRAISEKVREDQLTGALNRRGFEDMFNTELARIERSGKPLCISLMDIDNFKKLNDRLGHQAGDEALKHLVQVIKEVLRPTDVVARYGGEEFVILLPESSLNEAATVMRRVQRELTKRFFLHNNERVLITFSAGVTMYVKGERRDDVVDRADHAMYQAKKSGKNQVLIAEDILKLDE